MNRTLIYQIDETGQGLRIEQYLRCPQRFR